MKLDAVRCSHCSAALVPGKPSHKGTCFYCKERIKPDALKCKHCASYVGPGRNELPGGKPGDQDCGCPDISKKFTVTDVASPLPAGSVALPFDGFSIGGKAAIPQSGCSACESTGGLIFIRNLVYGGGKRNCWIYLPTKLNPDGSTHTYKRIEWTEDCQGELLNDPWA